MTPETLLQFRGTVQCRSAPPPLGLVLSGYTSEHPQQLSELAFSGCAAAGLPPLLEGAMVESLGDGQYRIASPPSQWLLSASAVHLHRDVSAGFYAALPPRPVPWVKRMFWGLMLRLAASRAGLALLRRLRR